MTTRPTTRREMFLGFAVLAAAVAIVGAALYGLSQVSTGTVGGAVAGGIVGLLVAVASKSFDFNKAHEAKIAEKRRDVYRRLLEPWAQVMVDVKMAKDSDAALANVDLAAMYSSCYDAVLYGSNPVVERYVAFRVPDPNRDAIDTLRGLAKLLIAMREDVTGKKSTLSEEAILGMFVNLSDEQRFLIRLRQHVESSPEAMKKVADLVAGNGPGPVHNP